MTHPPCPRLRIVVSNNTGRHSKNHRVIRDASRQYGVGRYHAMTAYGQVAPGTYNRCPAADPRSFPDVDSPSWRDALTDDRYVYVFVAVVVVLNQDILADKDVALQVDTILARYDSACTYTAVVINDDGGLTVRIRGGNIQPSPVQQSNRVSQADSG